MVQILVMQKCIAMGRNHGHGILFQNLKQIKMLKNKEEIQK